jgi:hypothetical protein
MLFGIILLSKQLFLSFRGSKEIAIAVFHPKFLKEILRGGGDRAIECLTEGD